MEFEGVKTWLTRQAQKQAKNLPRERSALGFVLSRRSRWRVAAKCVYVAVWWMYTSHRYPRPGDDALCFWVSIGAIPLMFLGNRVVPRRNLMEERMEEGDVGLAIARLEYGRAEVLLSLVLWVLFTGPRLVDWAMASVRESRRWQQLDTHSCAAVLWLLASRLKKVPYDEIQREIPWLDLNAAMPGVTQVPGVLKLKAPPPGLGLTDDLRKAIATGGPLEA